MASALCLTDGLQTVNRAMNQAFKDLGLDLTSQNGDAYKQRVLELCQGKPVIIMSRVFSSQSTNWRGRITNGMRMGLSTSYFTRSGAIFEGISGPC